jgi:hypothetical protein
MQQGGLVASQTGLTFEDTTAVLAAFSDRALKGADGGTSAQDHAGEAERSLQGRPPA